MCEKNISKILSEKFEIKKTKKSKKKKISASFMDEVTVDPGEFYDGEEAEGNGSRNEHNARVRQIIRNM